jgi:hypothetical protein
LWSSAHNSFGVLVMIARERTHSPAGECQLRTPAALNDPNLNNAPGFFIIEERRRDLLLEIVRSLGLTKKISSADLRADLHHRGEPHCVNGSDPQARGARGGAHKTRHVCPALPGPPWVAPRAKSSSSTAHFTHRERRRPAALNAPITN